MFFSKIIATALVVVLSTIVNGQIPDTKAVSQFVVEAPLNRTDDYINSNRRNYDKNIKDYDDRMDNFRQEYNARLNTITEQTPMLVDAVEQTHQRLNALELLSDHNKKCVTEYRFSISSSTTTKSSMERCVTTGSGYTSNMLSSSLTTRNTLQTYYTNTYDKSIADCKTKYKDLPTNYTVCVTTATTSANSYTVSNQKTFNIQMDSAQCSSNAYIKTALDCSFNVQSRTLSSMAQANVLIDKCLSGQMECPPCAQGQVYSCDDVYFIKRQEIDHKNITMPNVFYGRDSGNSSCLMLEIYDYPGKLN